MFVAIGVLAVNGIHHETTIAALHNQLFLGLEWHFRVGNTLQNNIHHTHLMLVWQQTIQNNVVCEMGGLKGVPSVCGYIYDMYRDVETRLKWKSNNQQ